MADGERTDRTSSLTLVDRMLEIQDIQSGRIANLFKLLCFNCLMLLPAFVLLYCILWEVRNGGR